MAKKQKSKRPRSSYNVGGPLQPGTPYTAAASTTGVAMPTPNIQEETTNPFAGLTRARTMEYAQNAGNQAMLQQELQLANQRLQNPMIYRPVATIREGQMMEIGPEDPYHPKHQQFIKDQRLVNPMGQLSLPKGYSQGGPTKPSYTRQSKNYWAQTNSKKKMAVGGPYSNINPLNPQGYSDNVFMEGQAAQTMDLSDSTQRKMKRRQVGRDIGAAAYGALEGVLDTVTFGLTDKLTDAGYDALAKAGRSQTAAQRARNERWRTSGQVVGATAGAVLTGGAATGSAIATTDVGNFANEESQGLQTGLNTAAKIAGIATGSTGSGGMGAFDGTAVGDAMGTVQGMSQYGGEGNALQNLYGATGSQGTQVYDALGKIGDGGGKEALKLLLQQAANNPEIANKLGITPQSPGQPQAPGNTQTPVSNQPIGSTSNAFGFNPTFGSQQPAPGTTLNMPASANMQLPFANGGYRKKMNPGGPTNPPVDLFSDTLANQQQTQSSQGQGLFPQTSNDFGMTSMFSPGFLDTTESDPRVLPQTAPPFISDTPPVGPYSVADPNNNVMYSRDLRGVNLSIQTGTDKKGNPTYSTVPMSSLEGSLNSSSFFTDPSLRQAAIDQLQGGVPMDIDDKGNVDINYTPAQKRTFVGRSEDNYAETMSSDDYLIAFMRQISNPEELALTKRNIKTLKGPSKDAPDCRTKTGKVSRACKKAAWSQQKYGGFVKSFAVGGPTDPPRNGLPTFDPQINSTQAVRDNTQTPVFEDPRLRAEKIAAAEQQQGLNFQNQVKEYVLANNPEATPEHIEQAISQTLLTGVMPEYIQPQGQYQTYGSSGQMLGTQTFATDPKVRAAQKAYNDKYGFSPKEYSPFDLLVPIAQKYRGIQAGPVAADRGYLTNNEYNIDIPGSVVAADLLLPFAPGLAGAGVKGLKTAASTTRQGLNQVGKFLTTQTPLKNAWRLNPNAYQYNLPQNTLWRGIGREGMQDALQSGVFRPKPNVEPSLGSFDVSKSFDKTYYSPRFKTADSRYGAGYIAEVPRDAAKFGRRYRHSDWSMATKDLIPINEGRILQKDWLRGYKPVDMSNAGTRPFQPGVIGANPGVSVSTAGTSAPVATGALIDDAYFRSIGRPDITTDFVNKSVETLKAAKDRTLNALRSPEGKQRFRNMLNQGYLEQKANKLTDAQFERIYNQRLQDVEDAFTHSYNNRLKSLLGKPVADLKFPGTSYKDTMGQYAEGMARNIMKDNAFYRKPFYTFDRPTPGSINLSKDRLRGVKTSTTLDNTTRRYYVPEEFTHDAMFSDMSPVVPGTVSLGTGFGDDMVTAMHEYGHLLQQGQTTPFERQLIALAGDSPNYSIFNAYSKPNIADDILPKAIRDTKESIKREFDYFTKSGGRDFNNEPFAFQTELRNAMLENKLLKNYYDPITPSKLTTQRILEHGKFNPLSNKKLSQQVQGRMLTFLDPSKYAELSQVMNRTPLALTGIAGATGVGLAASGNPEINTYRP